MKLGDLEYFCACLLRENKEHKTAATSEGDCVYCGYAVVHRKITEKDLRDHKKYGEELEKRKREALEIFIKDARYNDKVN